MIKYKVDILKSLKNKGFSSTRLRNEKIFGEAIIQKFRENDTNISLKTVNTLLSLLECGFDDILQYCIDSQDTQKNE